MYFYVTSYVICRVSFRCMPNWQLVLGDFFPLHGDCRDGQKTARWLADRPSTWSTLLLLWHFIFVDLPEFFLLLNSHFYDKMLLFLLHHYHVTLPTPQPLEIKEVTNHRFWIFIVISRWSKLVLLAAGVMIVISASICRVIFSTLNGTEGIL